MKVSQPSIQSMLIVCDNFWIGGRETFITDALKTLRKRGLQNAYLLANSIKNPLVEELFDDHEEVGSELKSSVSKWLNVSDKLLKNRKVDLVWVHHYRSMAGLFLAQHWQTRLHITLHGPPLSSAPLVNQDATGLAIAAHNGATISGVSEEILTQIREFSSNPSHQILLANRVVCPASKSDQVNKGKCASNANKPLRLTLFTRQGKLEHIRAASKLFANFRRQGVSCTLTIYTGITEELDSVKNYRNQWSLRTRLLGRKWLSGNLDVLLVLKYIIIRPLTNNVQTAIEATDIVLGMGRVVLEGLANRKVAILIGYNQVFGVVNSQSFPTYQISNFSGRSQLAQPIPEVVQMSLRQLSSGQQEFDTLQSLVNIENAWPQFETWLGNIYESSRLIPSNQSTKQLTAINQNDMTRPAKISRLLSPEERSTLSKLTNLKN